MLDELLGKDKENGLVVEEVETNFQFSPEATARSSEKQE